MRIHYLFLIALSVSSPAMAEDHLAPSLSGAPTITDAPGRGIQPDVSGHSAVSPLSINSTPSRSNRSHPWFNVKC
jgi:hypothetical protein